jgi:hypothetical protein
MPDNKLVSMLIEHSNILGGKLTFGIAPYDYIDHPRRQIRTWFKD